MLRHADIWRAIDRLAREHGYSPSGLARKAGLDPTTFNRSKRVTREGKLRWPSTESIGKVLAATGASLDSFVAYVTEAEGAAEAGRIPVMSLPRAGAGAHFDDSGRPAGTGWETAALPAAAFPRAYALRIAGDGMLPVYRDGDVVIVAPGARVRRGDRVVVMTRAGELLVRQLRRRSAHRIELRPLNPPHGDRAFADDEVAWMSRIVWVSQ